MMQSLLNSRAPFIGLSREGLKPLIFRRAVVVESLKGLTVTSETIQGEYLIVTAECLHVKAVRKFYGGAFASCHERIKVRRALYGWAMGERDKRARAAVRSPDRKQAARENKIHTLRVKLKRLTRRPHNPAIPLNRRSGGYTGSILTWYQQKPLRRSCRSKEALGRYWYEHQGDYVMTTKPWELKEAAYGSPEWGPERYGALKTEERATVKAQLAVLLQVPEREVSAFTR
jgi:hypothetical protein